MAEEDLTVDPGDDDWLIADDQDGGLLSGGRPKKNHSGSDPAVTPRGIRRYLRDVDVASTADVADEFGVTSATARKHLHETKGVKSYKDGNRLLWLLGSDDDSGNGSNADASTGVSDTQVRLAVYGIAGLSIVAAGWVVSGWLVGLFSATLALPWGTRFAATAVIAGVLAYYVAFDTDDDGQSMLDDLMGFVGGGRG